MQKCGNCGAPRQGESKFCGFCGSKFDELPTDKAENVVETSTNVIHVHNVIHTDAQQDAQTQYAYAQPKQEEKFNLSSNPCTTWLVLNMAMFILCGMFLNVFAIIGVVHSFGGNKLYKQGDHYGALEKSKKAKTMFFLGLILGIILSIIAAAANS